MQINRYSSSSWHKVFCLLKHLFKQLYIDQYKLLLPIEDFYHQRKTTEEKINLKKKKLCHGLYNHVINMVPIKIFQQIYMYDTAMYYDLLNIEYVTIFTKGSNLKI